MSLYVYLGINLRFIVLGIGVYWFSISKMRFIFFYDSVIGLRDIKKKYEGNLE